MENVAQRRFNMLANIALGALIVLGFAYAVPYAFQHSQLASPMNGPVRFMWHENGLLQCLILEKGKAPVACSTLTYDARQQIQVLYENPKLTFPALLKKDEGAHPPLIYGNTTARL